MFSITIIILIIMNVYLPPPPPQPMNIILCIIAMSPQLYGKGIDKKAQTFPLSQSGRQSSANQASKQNPMPTTATTIMMKIHIGFLALVATFTAVQSASFSYTAQSQWPRIYVTGNTGRQSPIDIKTDDVEEDDETLSALKFNSEYNSEIDGEFENACQNVEFTPDSSVNVVMTTPVGNYKLLQFHFH